RAGRGAAGRAPRLAGRDGTRGARRGEESEGRALHRPDLPQRDRAPRRAGGRGSDGPARPRGDRVGAQALAPRSNGRRTGGDGAAASAAARAAPAGPGREGSRALTSRRAQLVLAWAPALAYMGVIWALSSMELGSISVSRFPLGDKGVHVVEYALLGFLVAHATRA